MMQLWRGGTPEIQLMSSALATIHALAFHDCEPMIWDELAFKTLLALPTVLIWQLKHGFIMIQTLAHDEAEILTFAVDPKHQNKGIGHEIINKSMDYLKQNKINKLYLEVAIDNVKAIQLYEKLGFVPISIRKNYYKTSKGYCDARCMSIVLF
jgi:ribosomal-protein-alanine N-acetyltransferase